MHGYSSGSTIVVNAEVDSMSGVIESGVEIGLKTSPRQTAIEKAQADLRQEYDIRQERRRELDFLEKGGNPLDFRIGNAKSVSVQSTSVTNQHVDQFLTSEAKVTLAFTTSPHDDSVESSGRLRAPSVCEPNSADNLLLFDADNERHEAEKNSKRPTSKIIISQSEQSQVEWNQNAKETEDSAIFRPYARRNRSKTSRDGARSSSIDVVHSRGGSKDSTGLILKMNNHQDKNILSDSNRKSVSSNGNIVLRFMTPDDQASLDLNDVRASKVSQCTIEGSQPVTKLDHSASKYSRSDQQNQSCHHQQASMTNASEQPHLIGNKEHLTPVDDTPVPLDTMSKESETSFVQSNGVHDVIGRSRLTNSDPNVNGTVGRKGLELECSSTHNTLDVDVNIDSEVYSNKRNVDSDESVIVNLGFQQKQDPKEGGTGNEKDGIKAGSTHCMNDGYESVYQNHSANGPIMIKGEAAIPVKESLSYEVKCNYPIAEVEYNDSRVDRKVDGLLGDVCNSQENSCNVRALSLAFSCKNELHGTTKPLTDPSSATDSHLSPGNDLTLADKARKESSILAEAQMIQAKHKRIAELSVHALPLENRRKSHWDFVIEEMSWLANDFAQERIWKVTSAAQLCHQLAVTSRFRFEQQKRIWKLKEVAHTLAKAVMRFWYSAEELLGRNDSGSFPGNDEHDLVGTRKDDENELSKNRIRDPIMAIKELEPQYSGSFSLAVQMYAVRFLKYNCTITSSHVEAPKSPDRLLDPSILESSDQLKEILFYKIPPGALDIYRKSIETHLMRLEKLSDSVQDEVDTSMYDDIAEFGYQDNSHLEDDGDTTMIVDYGVFEGGKPLKFLHKRRKNLMKSFTGRPYVTDFPYGYTNGSQPLTLNGKRPSSLNAGSIPTKRTRTASRQRILSPFNGSAGIMHTQAKTDASSGDTSSFQDDHSTFHGPCQIQKSVEIESIGDFDKQITYERLETSVKHKKKKKPKHLDSTYDHGWQLDSAAFSEQRDNSKRRLENHNFESNGTSGLYQSNKKKSKMLKQSLDNTFANNVMSRSIPSPAASQMSNMSNTNRFIKLIAGRDRGRKAKALKMQVGNSGAGTPWSLFEDQALVVLVHDMGPNWELVSDAINSTLQLKCIFRKPKECKERHKILMDKSAGDGGDSGDDSGTSQPYPSTLPGIPKGSARQLFQRLQEPMEEDIFKSHFEKIIKIGQKQYYRSQNDNREAKQMLPVHNSHFIALSQVCPNNLNGVVLTPLDLCDASNPDVHSLGYQSSHGSGLSVSYQGASATMLPSSGANSPLQGSSAIAHGSNVTTFAGSVNTSIRDGRFGTQRMTSLPADDQQRIQQYNHMLSGRNFQQSNLPGAGNIGASERSAKVLPGGNSPGLMMGGMNRNMPVSRPGFQGMASSPMLNSATMVSSSVIGMPSTVNIHSGPTPGNPMLRSHDGLPMARTGHNSDNQRPMMIPEIQATQGTSQGAKAFNGLGSPYANQIAQPTHSHSGHQQQHQMSPQSNPNTIQTANHSAGSPQHAYPIRFPKERQLQQQRYLQQQQQSNSLMTPSQPPVSSNTPQIQQQTLSPVTPMSSQQQQKHQPGLSRNPSIGSNTQLGKQHQRHPQHQFQQSHRLHPLQRPQTQSQHPGKVLKGVGRGTVMAHQSLPLDPSHQNSLTMPSPPPTSKQALQMPSYSDNSSQTQVPQVSSGPTMAATHQARPSAVMISNPQKLQLQSQPSQKQLNQMQPIAQRMVQQNQKGIPDQFSNSQTDQQPVNKPGQPTIPHSCADSENGLPVVSKQLRGSIGSPPHTKSAGTDRPPLSQGSCLKQSLGGLTNQGLNAGSRFPQQTLLQTSPTQPETSQKLEQVQEHQSPQHRLHLQQQSQQQSQHLQRG